MKFLNWLSRLLAERRDEYAVALRSLDGEVVCVDNVRDKRFLELADELVIVAHAAANDPQRRSIRDLR